MEPSEAAPDLVGRTSARLLAAGVGRGDRLAALRLLAILDASTDIDGRVRRPLDDLAAEFELPPLGVIRSLEHLERAGAVRRDGARLEVLGDGVGGMHLADFLDDVRASFDTGVDAGAVARRARTRWFSRAGAGLVAVAAAAAVLTLAPGPNQTAVQPLAVGSSTAPTTSTTEVVPAAEVVPTTAAEPPPSDGATPPAPDVAAEPATTDVAQQPGPADAPPPVADTAVAPTTTCPTGSPTAEVIDDILRITNPFDHDIQISALTVAGIRIDVPISLVPGGTADWPLVATLTDEAPSVIAWEYEDRALARACPS